MHSAHVLWVVIPFFQMEKVAKKRRFHLVAPQRPVVAAAATQSSMDVDWVDDVAESLFADTTGGGGGGGGVAAVDDVKEAYRRPGEDDTSYWVRRTTTTNPLPLTNAVPDLEATLATLNTAQRPVTAGQSDHVLKEVLRVLRLCMHPSSAKDKEASASSSEVVASHVRDMPLYTADFEDQLLVEAGRRSSPTNPGLLVDAPACSFGEECVVNTHYHLIAGLDKGCILMSAMTPAELHTLYETGRKPKVVFPCICCIRYVQSKLVENIACGDAVLEADVVVQLFYNDVDKPNGYHRAFCHVPDGTRWDGTRRPFAMFLPALLRGEKDPVDHKWRIRQDRMRFFA
jgi:hypothetical protein